MVISKVNYPGIIYNDMFGAVLGTDEDDNVLWSKTVNHYVTHASAFKNIDAAAEFINSYNLPRDSTFFRIDPDETFDGYFYVKREKLKNINLW